MQCVQEAVTFQRNLGIGELGAENDPGKKCWDQSVMDFECCSNTLILWTPGRQECFQANSYNIRFVFQEDNSCNSGKYAWGISRNWKRLSK